jgi:hypothetical protein
MLHAFHDLVRAAHLALVLLALRESFEEVPQRHVIFVGQGAKLVSHGSVQPDRGVAHTLSILFV